MAYSPTSIICNHGLSSEQLHDYLYKWYLLIQYRAALELISLEAIPHEEKRVRLCPSCKQPAFFASSLTWQCHTKGCPAYYPERGLISLEAIR